MSLTTDTHLPSGFLTAYNNSGKLAGTYGGRSGSWSLASGDFLYSGSTEITITGYIGSGGAAAIPAEINGTAVTTIGEWAFSSCTSLTGITIPDSVKSIGQSAFAWCTGLTKITIGANMVLSNNSFPDGFVTAYNDGGKMAGTYGGRSGSWGLASGDFVYSGSTGITIIAYTGSGGAVTIPAEINGIAVTGIGNEAFRNCTSLTGITIPDSVESIGDWAFAYCTSLTEITIPDSVASIEGYAFYDCTSLASVTIGSGVTTIGYLAFYDCTSLASVTFERAGIDISWSSLDYSLVTAYAADGIGTYTKNGTTWTKQ
jgi:hypothetical protein